jgi:UDP-N-acetylmuramate--alanine ligase
MIKVGIFFGGPSREREISFAGGRTVYDNLNKTLFEPVPVFIDSNRNWVLLDWQYIYKGTIRDFYPPVEALPPSPNQFQIYIESLGRLSEEALEALIAQVGRRILPHEIDRWIDVAFLALHGEYGEDGQIQGILESMGVPYTGSGIRPCTIGMDKGFQKKMMEAGGFECPAVMELHRDEWIGADAGQLFLEAKQKIGSPLVVRPANQGSSIGVSIFDAEEGLAFFEKAVNRAFFIETIHGSDWNRQTRPAQIAYLRELTDIRDGLGFPLTINKQIYYHPEELLAFLDAHFKEHPASGLPLKSHLSEQKVILESFIEGKEFSCIVIKKENGEVVALPPTEIIKGRKVFDYRSKYLPGLSRKHTPIDLPTAQIEAIRSECERLFQFFEFNTYARIDGFITVEERIILNDPNTTSGMLPSSFFFHQAAEIGLNPSQFLTYIIRVSIMERLQTQAVFHPRQQELLLRLDEAIARLQTSTTSRRKIAVILGGYSYERHISVESGRNIFEKLASSDKYEPIPVFLMKAEKGHHLYQIPINLLLKDNADDIRDKILHYRSHPVIEQIKDQCSDLTAKYASKDVVFAPRQLSYEELAGLVDGVFIALHGRPGEDGQVQRQLEGVGLPYNGSGPNTSSITINKHETLQLLKKNGFPTTDQLLVYKEDFLGHSIELLESIKDRFGYPLIAKPVDDGCSSAVSVIKTRVQLRAYFNLIFRERNDDQTKDRAALGIDPSEEFPMKSTVLIEALISKEEAIQFMEITCGLLTHQKEGELVYEVFEPSEALASGEILSLEEKFLAGEGQNITPARLGTDSFDYAYIAGKVKADLEKAAKVLHVRGYARIDAFVRVFKDGRVETIIIEVNSLPGMTPATCIYHQAAINGYKPYNFIDKILEFGFNERKADPVLE